HPTDPTNFFFEGMIDDARIYSRALTAAEITSTMNGAATSDSDIVSITVTNVDDAAVITGNLSYTGNEGDAVVGDLDATDVEGLTDGTYFSVTTPATSGTATINAATGAWTFTPTDPNWFGSDSFTVTVTDDLGGTTTQVVSVTLASVNDAPVLTGANNLTSIDEDPVSNTGTLVSTLIAGQVTDADAGALTGIAVVGVDDTNGTWEYTTDGGSNWYAFGAVDSTSARLLAADANTSVRFVPDAGWNGTVTNGLTFHAWDQTSGTAGGTADLTSADTVLDQFNSVSYSSQDGTANWTSDWIEYNDDGSPVYVDSSDNIYISNNKLHVDNLDGGSFSQVTRGFDLTGATSATLTIDYDGIREGTVGGDRFTVEVSDDGGTTWTLLEEVIAPGATTANMPFSGSLSYTLEGSVSLTNDMVLRLAISAGFGGTNQHVNFDNVQVAYTGGGGTGGTTAFSTATASSSITVNDVNNPPTAVNDSASTDEDTVLNVAASGVLTNDIDDGGAGGTVTAGHTLNFDAGIEADTSNGTWEEGNGLASHDWTLNNWGTETTYTSSPTTLLPGITGAYQFSGTNSGATAPNYAILAGDPTNDSASFELWFRPNTLTGQQMLFETGGSGGTGTSLYLDGSNLRFYTYNGTNSFEIVADLNTLGLGDPTNEFIQVVGTLDLVGDQMELFVNGVSVGTTAYTEVDWSGSNFSGLGMVNSNAAAGSGNLNGDIAIFRFYESALTTAEVDDNYQAIAGSALTVTEVEGNTANVGNQITLASGALLTVNADGSYSYDPNGQFDYLGAGDSTTDSFTYTVADDIGQTDTATVTITINGINDAPVLTGANDLTAVNEDAISNGGTLVSSLLSGQVTDDTGDAAGIAVIGVDDTNGSWEYTTDGGSNWYAFGALDATSARLLAADANTYVRFV
ncbi:MAG: Ig-like domain-containing protein, partial [Gammaproteobacteria bacterium]|nr:Ig-like domain-containing protein [Gammaproteobacteria bacterium]